MRLKPPVWYANALRRTLLSLVPALARPDDPWAEQHLTPNEYALFARLSPQERAHGVDVARRLRRLRPDAPREVVAAALLHDVGKLGTPQATGWRILAHLLPWANVPPEPRLRGLAGARQARAHHARYGADLLRGAGAAPRVVELVQRHHSDGADPDAKLLLECDERT
ncbi:MAG: HDIG domain-containing metalloprotein [Trueperaceae bacterium]|nr:HDIG domain-containing protein [Truepera sp.]HRN18204.1 HDIG domain-containing protein [Trueperaceae bacterium]HRQ09482.1 HDIG domain-containing protein [Trueperaceae bacterium]